MGGVFANEVADKGLLSKIYKQFMQFNIKKNKQTNQKMGRRLNQTLSKENIQMAIKHMKILSTFLIIREMHIKTTV